MTLVPFPTREWWGGSYYANASPSSQREVVPTTVKDNDLTALVTGTPDDIIGYSQYADIGYWNDRYEARKGTSIAGGPPQNSGSTPPSLAPAAAGSAGFEWNSVYADLRGLIQNYVGRMHLRIFDLGCGTSDAARRMLADWETFPAPAKTVTGLDFSWVAVAEQLKTGSPADEILAHDDFVVPTNSSADIMISTTGSSSPVNDKQERSWMLNRVFDHASLSGLRFGVADVTNLQQWRDAGPNAGGTMDFVLDKGLSDALLTSEHLPDGSACIETFARELYESLHPDHGVAVINTLHSVAQVTSLEKTDHASIGHLWRQLTHNRRYRKVHICKVIAGGSRGNPVVEDSTTVLARLIFTWPSC